MPVRCLSDDNQVERGAYLIVAVQDAALLMEAVIVSADDDITRIKCNRSAAQERLSDHQRLGYSVGSRLVDLGVLSTPGTSISSDFLKARQILRNRNDQGAQREVNHLLVSN